MKHMEIIIPDHLLNCCKTKKYTKLKLSSNIARENEDTNIMSNGRDTRFPKQHGNLKGPSPPMEICWPFTNNATNFNKTDRQTNQKISQHEPTPSQDEIHVLACSLNLTQISIDTTTSIPLISTTHTINLCSWQTQARARQYNLWTKLDEQYRQV